MKKSRIQITSNYTSHDHFVFFLLSVVYLEIYGYTAQMTSRNWTRKNSNATTTNNNISKTTNASTSILNQLSIKEKETSGVYKWINTSNAAVENPMIRVFTNTSSTIKIQNPIDTKHELL